MKKVIKNRLGIIEDKYGANFPFAQHKQNDYQKNSLGYRSDEFKKNHDGLHILFSGCSATYGEGLEENEIWAKQVYEKISSNQPTSGFYNIAVPGMGIIYIVFHIFKYINNFNKPDIIFINFPTSGRFLSYDKKKKQHYYENFYANTQRVANNLLEIIPVLEYQYLYMLEQYCKDSGIMLIYGTWGKGYEFKNDTTLKSFIDIDVEKKIVNYLNNNIIEKSDLLARDNMHYGPIYHKLWAEMMYNEYMNRKNNDN
jgi:hypothetical protein